MTTPTRATPPPVDRSHGNPERSTPEVTVSMPAYDAAPFIRHAIESVLAQRDVALELVVVDDASSDETAAIAESIPDPRLRVLRNPRRRGIGACHNIVLRHSRAPYIAHVDADDYILPGALRRLLDAVAAEPTAGQAHCYFFDVDRDGLTTRDAFAERWQLFHRDRPPTLDYRDALQTRAVANALRTFPRRVLEELGGFDEHLPFAVDYDMALRVVERYRIVLVPEFLYARRLHRTNTVASRRFKAARVWWRKFRVRQRLIRDGRISFASHPRLDLWSFLRDRGRDTVRTTHAALVRHGRHVAAVARWRCWAPLSAWLYRRTTERLSWWPLPAVERRKRLAGARVAYYLRAYPASSETFIQREVSALREQGLCLDVIAENPHDPELFDDDAHAAAALAVHLGRLGTRAPAALRAFLIRRPWTVARLFGYVLFRRHGAEKTFAVDRVIWRGALRLAGVLVARGATHVHAPWAFRSSLVALLGARLARVGFSVQARASDLYQDTSQQGLEERLGHADFIITNAHYNEATIRSLLPPGSTMPIHVIYEGVDLERLRPVPRRANDVPLILSVARLIEPKGLDVLLRACRILKDAGRVFRCEILGGRSTNEMNYYLTLRKLHRALDLEDDVRFLGPHPFTAVLEKYVEADVFVLPAVPASNGRRDVTPNVVIEAMAMRLPIVSTHSGAIPELIVDGVSGLLVPPRDETALAHALARLLDDGDLRRTLGAAARAAAETRFDIHQNAVRYAALFNHG